MKDINRKAIVPGTIDETVSLAIRALEREGFGVLTRINLQEIFQEKLGKSTPPAVILGACAPALAYEAYSLNSNVAALLPCNLVIREENKKTSVEIARPSALLKLLADRHLSGLGKEMDQKLEKVLVLIETASASRKAQEECGAARRGLEEECWDRDGRWGIRRQSIKKLKRIG